MATDLKQLSTKWHIDNSNTLSMKMSYLGSRVKLQRVATGIICAMAFTTASGAPTTQRLDTMHMTKRKLYIDSVTTVDVGSLMGLTELAVLLKWMVLGEFRKLARVRVAIWDIVRRHTQALWCVRVFALLLLVGKAAQIANGAGGKSLDFVATYSLYEAPLAIKLNEVQSKLIWDIEKIAMMDTEEFGHTCPCTMVDRETWNAKIKDESPGVHSHANERQNEMVLY